MSIKRSPRDFEVRELLEFEADPAGEHYVHLLRKEKLDTQEALSRMCRIARVKREDIAFAGLKDRQGRTEQWVSVRGRRVDIKEPGLEVIFKGRSAQPIQSKMSDGNRFRIVLRGLHRSDAERLRAALPRFAESGYVNYFDDQRFGCVRHGQGFAMRDVLAGRYEKALQRLIARPSPIAKGGDTKLKHLMMRHWGDWDVCARIARGPVFAPALQHLRRRPADFAGAIQKLNSRTRLIHSFAYQSYLWNRAVSSVLDEVVPVREQMRIDTLIGELTTVRDASPATADRLRRMVTPLYAPDGAGGDPAFRAAVQRFLKAEQLTPEKCAKNTLPGMVWREEPRDLLVFPRNVYANQPEPDETARGASKLEVAFSLPRGVYATMLIKHLFAGLPKPARSPRSEPAQRSVNHD